MALKRPNDMLATFSMASMTDIIFLLLVFFMVTSTYVFPTAIDVTLPEGVEQSPSKPVTRVFIDRDGAYYIGFNNASPEPVAADALLPCLTAYADTTGDNAAIAVYADVDVQYGKVVEVLNLGAANSIKMVLATRVRDSQIPVAHE